jgi:rhodanese-related sulfurtransferase/ABC-type phosphate/phosphonate transport system substrate-binding protein
MGTAEISSHSSNLRGRQVLAAFALASASLLAHAQQQPAASNASSNGLLTAVVAVEPTSKKDSTTLSHAAFKSSFGKAVGQGVDVSLSEDLADVMRATRSAGYDMFIAPAQVAASAMQRGYELIGVTSRPEQYVLVARVQYENLASLRGKRLFLPQQDSLYTYMARGMLNAQGLSLKDMGKVHYGRYPQAGLTAMHLGLADATVVRQSEWADWVKDNPAVARVLGTSTPVPGGLSVVVKKSLPNEMRTRIAKWFTQSTAVAGLTPLGTSYELPHYKSVAELGLFTPTYLPGATVVTWREVQKLIAGGAVMVDTRTEKEFNAKHIASAVLVPYHEKSLKDVAFDAKLDDFAGLAKLDKSRPTIFACNGAECWKSYKASKAAVDQGFKQVYWFRGGLPEWDQAGLPVEAVKVAAASGRQD